jgi:hypothetical protein
MGNLELPGFSERGIQKPLIKHQIENPQKDETDTPSESNR